MKRLAEAAGFVRCGLLCLLLAGLGASGGCSRGTNRQMEAVPVTAVKVNDSFWSPKLAVLPLKLFDSSPLIAGQSTAPIRVHFGPAYPLPKRLRCAANLASDRQDG